jgi:hypothetical protein
MIHVNSQSSIDQFSNSGQKVFFNNQSSTGGVHNEKMVLKEKKIEVHVK